MYYLTNCKYIEVRCIFSDQRHVCTPSHETGYFAHKAWFYGTPLVYWIKSENKIQSLLLFFILHNFPDIARKVSRLNICTFTCWHARPPPRRRRGVNSPQRAGGRGGALIPPAGGRGRPAGRTLGPRAPPPRPWGGLINKIAKKNVCKNEASPSTPTKF